LTLLKDLNLSPLDAIGIEVIPGHISHEGHLYTFIRDMDLSYQEFSASAGRQREEFKLHQLAAHHFELVVEEQEDKATLGASYKAVHSSNQNIHICLGALQTTLQSFLKTDISSVGECSPFFEIDAGDRKWSFHELTLRKASEQTTNSLRVSNACWSILAWDSWTIPSGEDSQWLDIEIFKTDSVALFAIAHQLYSRYAFDTPWNRRSHVAFIQIGDCPHCLVRVAALAWSTVPVEIPSPRTKKENTPPVRLAPMNDVKKKGSITTYACHHRNERKSIMFELNPSLRNEGSSATSRHSWTRLLGISKSVGKG
jgi:hypothetical protein